MSIAPADKHKPWARRAQQLHLDCHCFDCLRDAGVTPDHAAHNQHRRAAPPTEIPTEITDPLAQAAA